MDSHNDQRGGLLVGYFGLVSSSVYNGGQNLRVCFAGENDLPILSTHLHISISPYLHIQYTVLQMENERLKSGTYPAHESHAPRVISTQRPQTFETRPQPTTYTLRSKQRNVPAQRGTRNLVKILEKYFLSPRKSAFERGSRRKISRTK